MDKINKSEEKVPGFKVPDWAADPTDTTAHLEVTKEDKKVETIDIAQNPYYVFGRNIIIEHPSSSRKHAAIVHHKGGKIYIIDLQSAHGTFIDGAQIKPNAPLSLKDGNEIKFGASSKVFVFRGVYKGDNINNSNKRKEHSSDESSTKKSKTQNTPTKVRARHLLVKHRDSRRPSSWKTAKIIRSKEEAAEIIKGFKETIEKGEKTLEEMARIESDCSSAKKGGDLGFFSRGQMQKPFEDTAFTLGVGEISDIIFTDSGVHLIERIE